MFTFDPNNCYFLGTINMILSAIGGIAAFTLFIVGFKRYKKEQLWKKKEFIAIEIEKFSTNPACKKVMLMIDWKERYIELFPYKKNWEEKFKIVNREILIEALALSPPKCKFTDIETAIRDCFDIFLENFEKFESFITAGLLKAEDFQPYLKYWIDLIADHHNEKLKDTLFNFIRKYNYQNVISFFNRFGKNIPIRKRTPDNE